MKTYCQERKLLEQSRTLKGKWLVWNKLANFTWHNWNYSFEAFFGELILVTFRAVEQPSETSEKRIFPKRCKPSPKSRKRKTSKETRQKTRTILFWPTERRRYGSKSAMCTAVNWTIKSVTECLAFTADVKLLTNWKGGGVCKFSATQYHRSRRCFVHSPKSGCATFLITCGFCSTEITMLYSLVDFFCHYMNFNAGHISRTFMQLGNFCLSKSGSLRPQDASRYFTYTSHVWTSKKQFIDS